MRCWEQAPYLQKSDADANFIRMLTFGCRPQHAAAVRLGVASHNLFDIAYALLLREENDVAKYVTFEMVEGMAQGLQQVVHKLSGGMLLYCPTATQEEFQYAVAYLTRRPDENTAPENFLRHLFHLQRGSSDWKEQVDLFNKGGESPPQFLLYRVGNKIVLKHLLGTIICHRLSTRPTLTGLCRRIAAGATGFIKNGTTNHLNRSLCPIGHKSVRFDCR